MTDAVSSSVRSAGRICSMRAAERGVDRGGQLDATLVDGCSPPSVDSSQDPVVDQEADELAQEQGVALARLERASEHPTGEVVGREQVECEVPRGRVVERSEDDHGGGGPACFEECRPAFP